MRLMLCGILALGFGSTAMSSCGYDGWVRYPCQEKENWHKPECKKPGCIVTGTCTEFLIPEGLENGTE